MSTFALPADLVDQVHTLAGALESYVAEARDEWSQKSERWQEGDDGVAVDGWLDEVDDMQLTLSNLPSAPE